MSRVRIKICCIQSINEARVAVQYGADALGLVSEMPSGPGVISEQKISHIATSIPPGVCSFLLTSKQSAADIIDQQRRCGVDTIQIVDRLKEGGYSQLRDMLPGTSIVQVVHVTSENALNEAENTAMFVDSILLDSGNTDLRIKELGGTGRTHDWNISREICDRIPVPVFLAGGLNPENVREAIEKVKPFGVDVCNGVCTDGKLDREKLKSFIDEVRLAAI